MGLSKTRKILNNLKQRVVAVEINFELEKNKMISEVYTETVKCKDEIKTLIEAYEKQIELNKKQNIKIKNQRRILKVLQQKQGDVDGKANI